MHRAGRKRNRVSVPRPSPAIAERIAGHALKHRELVEQMEIAAAAKVSGMFPHARANGPHNAGWVCRANTRARRLILRLRACVQRARKEADKAAGKLADEEKKKQEEPEAPATPEIVVPPAPTDDEVEEAKKDYESKMKVLKDEVARLQGEKTKLFQLLKQQCAAEPFMRLRLVKSVRPCNCINARPLSLRFGCADKLPTRPRLHVPRL